MLLSPQCKSFSWPKSQVKNDLSDSLSKKLVQVLVEELKAQHYEFYEWTFKTSQQGKRKSSGGLIVFECMLNVIKECIYQQPLFWNDLVHDQHRIYVK